MDAQVEIQRTQPDYVVYLPKSMDGSTHDTGNEHFLVFDGPDGSLMVLWTQSTFEGQPNQRIVFAQSKDEGKTWTEPKVVAGPVPPASGDMASWGFPLVSKSGRIYAIYSRHIGIDDIFKHTTGLMGGKYSDDCGKTWSDEQIMAMRRSALDNPDTKFPANWIVWQKPTRVSKGKYFCGMTRWVSPAVSHPPIVNHWTAHESVVEFLRFENIDDCPEPKDIEISWFARDDDALRVLFPGSDEVSVVQEPSIVKLPDGRLHTSMRTRQGSIYYSLSADEGETWAGPKPLLFKDGGAIFHRNWPYAWAVCNDTEQSDVAGNVGISRLPAFKEGMNTSALGGWIYAIHSRSRHPEEAWEFVEFMTSPEIQKLFATGIGKAPTRRALFSDPEVLDRHPHFADLLPVLETASPRPRTPIYPQVSHILQRFLHKAISDPGSDIPALARQAEEEIRRAAAKLRR